MIKHTSGNILEDNAEALVNTVNCVGIMGRGIALQFKHRFSANFKAYEAACKRDELQPGKMFIYETSELTTKYIINFPTKRHWRGKSRIEDIKSGLTDLVAQVKAHNIKSIAIPPLGSGLGGLDWNDVLPLIEAAFQHIKDVDVIIYEPKGAPKASAISTSRDVPAMTKGRAALIALMQQYLNGLMDPSVTLLEVHKLMYFMQEAGEPLRLKYQKALYGPYAENLRHVLNKIEGHFVSGYADGGDTPTKELELVPGAVADADDYLKEATETQSRIDRVSELVDGFETPFGLELLSTVHWAATYMGATSIAEVISTIYAWNDRKKQFSERQITIAYNWLDEKHWLKTS